MADSSALQWACIRRSSSFLMKRNGLYLSKEPNNLKNRHSYRNCSLVKSKVVGVQPTSDNKGVVLVTSKNIKLRQKPAQSLMKRSVKRPSRRTLAIVRNTLRQEHAPNAVVMAALRKTSAILKSQKPVKVKKSKK